MVLEEIRSIRSGRRDLRRFGITMCIALAVLAVLLFWRGKGVYVYAGLLSPVFLILGLAAPVALRPVHKVWMSLAIVLGWFMTRVILSLVFFLGVTPVGVLGRLFGKKFLDVRMQDSRETYWIRREHADEDPARYERQY
ncbi:SxtJ family membrane protein [Candidatus Eisenbacteria bacterium]|uniref:SxtJ family membrane protein n=1 Tax=Eiseniibacteriota bacterium TaxID=2212470 RepID=A0ABV6YNK4_UNCEI